MAEKLFEDVEEMFEGKPTWSSDTKIVGLKIPEFLKKIEEKKGVDSPRFKLSGVEFYIKVTPGCDYPEFIRVSVVNCAKEIQTTSVTFLDGSGKKIGWKMDEVKANNGRGMGYSKFLSHEKFKAWDHGDVFNLKATVTLHKKVNPTGEGWIRYCSPVCLVSWFQYCVQEQVWWEPGNSQHCGAGGAQVSEKRGHHPCCYQGHHAGRGDG